MLISARDKYGEDIDVARRLMNNRNEEERPGKFPALFGESVFHNGGGVLDDGLVTEDNCVDFGDDSPQDIKKELSKQISKAKENRLLQAGTQKFVNFDREAPGDIQIENGKWGLAKIPPMMICLDCNKEPVKVKVPKYPVE